MRSQQLADTIKATLEEQAGFLDQLSSSFLTRHELLSRQDFRELVEKLLQRFPTIQAVEWAPYVSASERNWFELEAKRIFPGYTISELGEASGSRPKPIGKDAFPVFYIEPLADNVTALGLDLASDPHGSTPSMRQSLRASSSQLRQYGLYKNAVNSSECY